MLTLRSAAGAKLLNPARQAYWILYLFYTAEAIGSGADKFFNLTAQWTQYLAPVAPAMTGLNAYDFMRVVGVIEIALGILVAIRPRLGARLFALWLFGIILNLLSVPGYFDIALRDLGLAAGALALSCMPYERNIALDS